MGWRDASFFKKLNNLHPGFWDEDHPIIITCDKPPVFNITTYCVYFVLRIFVGSVNIVVSSEHGGLRFGIMIAMAFTGAEHCS